MTGCLRRIGIPAAMLVLGSIGSAKAGECMQTTFGKCYTVHGRYAIYANHDGIWPVGTKRFLSATDPELDTMLEKSGWEDHVLFGDFSVCPESPYERGHMQSVCIQNFQN